MRIVYSKGSLSFEHQANYYSATCYVANLIDYLLLFEMNESLHTLLDQRL